MLPLGNPSKRTENGYSLLGRNIPLFLAVNELPNRMDPKRLDDGTGIEATLRRNEAQYHASCRILFSNSKLERAKKISSPAADRDESSTSCKIPRRRSDPRQTVQIAFYMRVTEIFSLSFTFLIAVLKMVIFL